MNHDSNESGESGQQSHDVRSRKGCKDPRLLEDVGSVGDLSRDVKEQMLMRLDDIGENYENLKAKVVSYTTNKTKQARGGQQETQAPIEVDHVSGSEPEVEDW